MQSFIDDLYNEMTESVTNVLVEQEDMLQQAERAYHVAEKYMLELKQFILSYTFQDKEEEIYFFKEEKPKFLSEFIYYAEVFYIEFNIPVGNDELQRHYQERNLERINIFFQRNRYLYNYYRTGKTYLDHIFFLRNADEIPLLPAYSCDNDTRFSTVYSFKLAKLLAFEQLQDYLNNKILRLDMVSPLNTGDKRSNAITWTGSKAELIELAYALQSSGSFNFGKADVKRVITYLEDCFDIKVGNFYRVFQGQRIRKKSRTIFLDSLKENLIQRMDESDLNPKAL